MAYITVAYIGDKDVKRICEKDGTFLTKADEFLTDIYTQYQVSMPDTFAELSFNEKQLLEWKVIELASGASVGLNYEEVQDGLIDKYQVKNEAAIKKIYGDNTLGVSGLLDAVVTALAGTKRNITLDYNY